MGLKGRESGAGSTPQLAAIGDHHQHADQHDGKRRKQANPKHTPHGSDTALGTNGGLTGNRRLGGNRSRAVRCCGNGSHCGWAGLISWCPVAGRRRTLVRQAVTRRSSARQSRGQFGKRFGGGAPLWPAIAPK